MLRPFELSAVLATISKHDTGGIIAVLVGAVLVVLGIVRAATRTPMLLAGLIVVVVGILLLTRTI